MILAAEFVLLLFGIGALLWGKLFLTKHRVVHGLGARVLGLVACSPVPLSFVLIHHYTGLRPFAANPDFGPQRWFVTGIEAGVLLACVAVVYAVGWLIADSPGVHDSGQMERSIRRKPQKTFGRFVLFLGLAILLGLAGVMISGKSWSDIVALAKQTPAANGDEMAPAVPGPVPAYLMPTSWQPKVDRMLAYNRRSLADAYDRVGKKSPRWNVDAYVALELAAQYFSNPNEPNAQPKDIHAATLRARAAGCDDPLILYLYARSIERLEDTDLDRAFAKAATAMQSSAYPPSRRAAALWKSAQRKLRPGGTRGEALGLIDATIRLLPTSAREEERCLDLDVAWYEFAHHALAAYKQLGLKSQDAWLRIDRVLATEKELESTRLLLKGDFHIQWAWEARGSGFADTVTPERFELFDQRLTVAREALERSWELTSTHGKAAHLMLSVELGQPRGRAEMEKWFERAIEREADINVCRKKLKWLHPAWHGSIEEMLAFARACRDSANWARTYPLIMAETHQWIADLLPNDAAKTAYYRRPDVAADMFHVYPKLLECYPDDDATRSEYAYYAYVCGQPKTAHVQFELLGDNLCGSQRLPVEMLRRVRLMAFRDANAIPAGAPVIVNGGG